MDLEHGHGDQVSIRRLWGTLVMPNRRREVVCYKDCRIGEIVPSSFRSQFPTGQSDSERDWDKMLACRAMKSAWGGMMLAILSSSLLATAVALRSRANHRRQADVTGSLSSISLRPSPIVVLPHPQRCLSIAEEEIDRIRARMEPLTKGMSISLWLHSLSAFGLDYNYRRGELASSTDTLRLFADDEFSKKIFGTSLMVRTTHGIRCTSEVAGGARESHRDYCLAILSKHELPLSFPFAIGDKSFTFRDFLTDSIANFHLEQEEIEWSAMAYVRWLPPERDWTNKFGETFSFDQLAVELMKRPLNKATCLGCHIIEAMIVLSRVDSEICPILSSSQREGLLNRLRRIVQVTEVSQACDGSWGPEWYDSLLDNRQPKRWLPSDRFLATCHISEWLMLLPSDLRVSDDRLRRSALWLYVELRGADDLFVRDNYCPCTHAANVLQMVCNETRGFTADSPCRVLSNPLSASEGSVR